MAISLDKIYFFLYIYSMKNEIWKDIEGYEGLYQVSNLGRIKSLHRRIEHPHSGFITLKERILKPSTDTSGYLFVRLCNNGKSKQLLVHRLVAQTFLENPQKLPEVNHIDECKSNNQISNLEYCDRSYNINYGTATVRAAKTRTNHPSFSKQILCIETGIIYPSISEAGRLFNSKYAPQNISCCCLGKTKVAYGYHWCYVDKKLG